MLLAAWQVRNCREWVLCVDCVYERMLFVTWVVDMRVLYIFVHNVRFCGHMYYGSRLTSTQNTMTLVFQSWDNIDHSTGFSASYLVTGSGKCLVHREGLG